MEDDRLTLIVMSTLQQYQCLRTKKGDPVQGSKEEIHMLICVFGLTYLPTEQRWKVTELRVHPYG
jgi:hypothetical protein